MSDSHNTIKPPKRRALKPLLLGVLLAWTFAHPLVALGDYASTEFDRGNQLYEQNKFAEAISAYDNIITNGKVSAAVFFNRGNAFFKLNQLGKAIDSYRRAEQLSPRDPEIRANLQFARSQVSTNTTMKPERWKSWLSRLTVNEWTKLAVVTLWLLFGLLALIQWRRELKQTLNKSIIAVSFIFVLLAIGVSLSVSDFYSTRIAIVVAKETSVHNGPLDESQVAFPARDGAELRVLDSRNEWLQVTDGKRVGWLKRDSIVLFAPAANKAKS
jgi:tetratricopeptide (TPR) repeat protein